MKTKQCFRKRGSLALSSLLAAVLVLLAQSESANAQWTTNGNNINNTNTGNVGIGTATPEQKLSVNGSINLQDRGAVDAPASDRLRIVSNYKVSTDRSWDTSKPSWLGDFGLNDGFNVFRAPATSGAPAFVNLFFINPSGNVGIGTSSPSYKLQVVASNGQTLLGDPIGTHFFFQIRPNSGKQGWLAFTEDGVADRWAVGIRNGDPRLYLSTGNVGSLTDRVVIDGGGNVGIGTVSPANKLHVAGSITVDGNINAKYQDVAEWVESSQTLSAGTVVVLDHTKSNQVVASSQAYDTRVAGVISEQPGLTLGERGNNKVLVATTGRVRVKVDASWTPIHIGDLLVTSNVPGVAMKSEPIKVGGRLMHMPGTLIGKALEPLEKGSGNILVLLSLQ